MPKPPQSFGTPGQPDFLFTGSHKRPKKLTEKLSYWCGTSYLTGLVGGGSYGLWVGIRQTQGLKPRLRINGILNNIVTHGSGTGNLFGVLAVLYALSDAGIVYWIRHKERDDILNNVAAGLLTGLIWKGGAGVKPAAIAATLGGLLACAGSLLLRQAVRKSPSF